MPPPRRLPLLLCLLLLAPVVCHAQRPELVVQTGHTGISSMAFSPDGRLLAICGGTVKLWDFRSGRELRELAVEGQGFGAVAFSPDGGIIAAGGGDTTTDTPTDKVILWDVRTGRELHRYSLSGPVAGGRAIAFSADGTKVFAVTSFGEINLRLVDFPLVRRIKLPVTEFIDEVDFAPGGGTVAAAVRGGGIITFDVQSGRRLSVLTGHSSGVKSLAFSRDGKRIASAGLDKTVRLWDSQTGREVHNLNAGDGATSVAFSPDGRTLVGGGRLAFRRWDTESGRELRAVIADSGDFDVVAFAPGGESFVARDGNTARVWDARSGQELRSLAERVEPVRGATFSADGATLAFSSGDRIRLWDMRGAREMHSLSGHTTTIIWAGFSPDGRTIASLSSDGAAKLWDVRSGKEVFTISGQVDTFPGIAFSPDSKMLAGVSYGGGSVKLWEVASGRALRTLSGHAAGVSSVVFSPGGGILASSGRDEREVILWDVGSGRSLHTLPGVSRVAFSPDGKTLVGWGINRAILIDVASGRELRPLMESGGLLKKMDFSPDGKTVAGNYSLTGIRLWDVGTGRLLESMDDTFENREKVRRSIPDFDESELISKMFVVGRRVGGGLNFYERATYTETAEDKEFCSLIAFGERDWLVVTPDGLFDGSPAAWRQLIWRFDNNTFSFAPVEVFFNEFYYPGLLQEILAGKRPTPPAGKDIAKVDRRQPTVNVSLSDQSASGSAPLKERTVAVKIEVAENTDRPASATHPATGGARDVRLFRNGSLVRVWRGDVLGGQRSVTLEASVPVVAGENRFTAYAFNSDSVKSADATLAVTGAESLRRKGAAYVVALGVNEYAPNPFFRNLRYAVADAEAFAAEIRRQQERLGRYAKVEVIGLNDAAATKANVLGALAELARKAQPEDAVLVYFAGHGLALGREFYLIPHDFGAAAGRANGPADAQAALAAALAARGISDRELEAAYESVDGGQFTLVIDACNSGQALGGEREGRGPMNSKGLAQLAYEKGMYILTAAQSFQAAQEAPQLGHGLLTYALVEEGLKQAAADQEPRDGTILVREWLDYAVGRVPVMQIDKMRKALDAGGDLSFAEEERGLPLPRRSGQAPRVFYRRELEAQPLVVAKPAARPAR